MYIFALSTVHKQVKSKEHTHTHTQYDYKHVSIVHPIDRYLVIEIYLVRKSYIE